MISYERGADGIVVLTIDDPVQHANTMNDRYVNAMTATMDRLEAERDNVTGVIVTSAKSTFFAGGDLPLMSRATREDAPRLAALLTTIKRDLRRLETYGRPVVAAINGAALGGGLEIALACHYRIALDTPDTRIGFPEVTLGLLPGAGGVTRTVRMLGLAPALTTWLLTGRRLRPADAVAAGLIDELVPPTEATHPAPQPTAAQPTAAHATAAQLIAAQPTAAQPTAAQPTAALPTAAQPTAALPTAAHVTAAHVTSSQLPSTPPRTTPPSTLTESTLTESTRQHEPAAPPSGDQPTSTPPSTLRPSTLTGSTLTGSTRAESTRQYEPASPRSDAQPHSTTASTLTPSTLTRSTLTRSTLTRSTLSGSTSAESTRQGAAATGPFGERRPVAAALSGTGADELRERAGRIDTGLMGRARAWIVANPDAAQPWDRDGYRMPGGTPASPKLAAQLPAFAATLRKQLKGCRLPAPEAILATAVEGAQVDFETAQTIETRHLITLLTGQIAKNMIGALFSDLRAVNGGLARPQVPVRAAVKVAVLGAGMMGAGIAYACARAGLDVVVKDVSLDAARRAVASGEPSVLARITPTASLDDLAGADVVIEAVFEDADLKKSVFADVLPVVAPDALLASNTSTLPITDLASGVDRPADFIGMHFFSPVGKMPLLEIVAGARTGDEAIARAFDLGRRIGKTPIVVNDGRGFFTSRVIGKFVDEALLMLAAGVPAPMVEQAALQAGYPTGPLALADEVSIALLQRIHRASGVQGPSKDLVDFMVDEHGRPGRAVGRGFYAYAESRRTGLWTGLAELATRPGREVPFEDLQERFLFSEAIDARKCLAEGVLRTAEDGNVGSILGIGFPAWTGGVLRYATQHRDFAGRARQLADRYGDRFAVA
ncbi:3-hydroxyacyl-CoA dehydrogenase NAD-binding domain-containing protein [Actinoplanes sp. NPDC051343]|uniref:3-hydroxyacyl-CoA dehydrogenase NAD-binding domain-containing protein n=1 Tax=Actinoplanes sp. NPDC051343 TaxID=3363906 RepID=UPI0037A343CB